MDGGKRTMERDTRSADISVEYIFLDIVDATRVQVPPRFLELRGKSTMQIRSVCPMLRNQGRHSEVHALFHAVMTLCKHQVTIEQNLRSGAGSCDLVVRRGK